MERNIKLVVEYDGTDYCGWQEQDNAPTVQAALKRSIVQLTGEEVILNGAGRTDTGVHARGQVANFRTHSRIPAPAFVKALNAKLPPDIVIQEAEEVPMDFHAQYAAKAKAYSYQIISQPIRPVLENRYAHWVWFPLRIESLKEACGYLIGTHDFSSFEAANSPRKSRIRTINFIDILQEHCYIKIFVEADGFLYHMVRNIVGTLLTIERKSLFPKQMKNILEAKSRQIAGPTVAAKGLCLEYVKYENRPEA